MGIQPPTSTQGQPSQEQPQQPATPAGASRPSPPPKKGSPIGWVLLAAFIVIGGALLLRDWMGDKKPAHAAQRPAVATAPTHKPAPPQPPPPTRPGIGISSETLGGYFTRLGFVFKGRAPVRGPTVVGRLDGSQDVVQIIGANSKVYQASVILQANTHTLRDKRKLASDFLATELPSWKQRETWLAKAWRKKSPMGIGIEARKGVWVTLSKSGTIRSDDDPDGLTLVVELEDAPAAALEGFGPAQK